MMTRTENKQIKFHMITIEDFVPEYHFLRKLDRVVDFSFIYDVTKDYYCQYNGQPREGRKASRKVRPNSAVSFHYGVA